MHLPGFLRRHSKNDDTPYEVSGLVTVIAALIVGFFGLAAAHSYLLRSGSLAAVVSASLVDLVNSDRAGQGLAPLAANPTLTAVAQAKANDMAQKGYFAHNSPDGHEPWYWFNIEGYVYSYAGENLAVDFTDSTTVEEAWMNSPEHRANLLNSHYTEVGIAIAHGTFEGHSTTFVAQEFGAPQGAPIAIAERAPEPVNPAPAASSTPTKPAVAGTATKKPPTASTTPGGPVVTSPSTNSGPAASSTAALAGVSPSQEGAARAVALTPTGSEGALGQPASQASWLTSLVASPKTVLSWAYFILAVAIMLIFAYMTELELHRRHTRHAVEAGGLLVLMLALFTLADFLFFAHPVLAAL